MSATKVATNHEIALALSACGIITFPLGRGTKLPLIKWADLQNPTNRPTPDDIRVMWTDPLYSGENIAVIAGETSRLWIVDADSAEGYAELRAAFPSAPWTVKTRRGGHVYFRIPGTVEAVDLRNKTGVELILPTGVIVKVDIRAHGGIVVGPWSRHATGTVYEPSRWPWTKDDVRDLPELDLDWRYVGEHGERSFRQDVEELKQIRTSVRTERVVPATDVLKRAIAYLDACPGAIEGQNGNTHTFLVASHMVKDFALSEEDALAVMLDWNMKCVPPWKERDLRGKIQHAIRTSRKPLGSKIEDRPQCRPSNGNGNGTHHYAESEVVVETFGEREPGSDDQAPPPAPKIFTFEPFLKQAKVERPDPIVDGLILQGSRVVLSGAPKRAQKTWTLLQLGLCVASGMDFLGFKVSKPGRVLFYSGEEPAWHVQERLAALSDYFGVTDPDTPLLLAGEDVPRIRLNIADMVDQLCATAQAWGATMIIMEPFRRLHDVNENDSTEIAPILDRLTDITRKTGAAVVLSHHTGKNKETSGGAAMRGSSDIHSWYDLGLAATTKDGSDDVHIEVESRHASASFFDMRLRKECEYLPGRFRRMWLERVLPSSNLDPVPDSRLTELRPKILKVLDKVGGGPLTKNTVCDRVEGRKADILNVIRIMLGAAELAEVGGGVSVVPGTSSQ